LQFLFLHFLVSFLHRAQLWAEGLCMPGSALNLVCGITINSAEFTDSTNGRTYWNCMSLTKRMCFYHLLPNVMHRHLNPGWQSMMKMNFAEAQNDSPSLHAVGAYVLHVLMCMVWEMPYNEFKNVHCVDVLLQQYVSFTDLCALFASLSVCFAQRHFFLILFWWATCWINIYCCCIMTQQNGM
jgi:hypothetical protein